MKFIPVFTPNISLSDGIATFRTVLSGDISGTAKTVAIFEKNFSQMCRRTYGIAVSNGSVALDLAFASLDLRKGDEVILPSFAIISCLAAVLRAGATPVFVDVDRISWNLTLKSVESALSSKTKAVLVVHTYGLPSDIIEIERMCLERGIFLVEDAAEAHGMAMESRVMGSFGDVSTFSFYANKHVTAGEGGMILTNNLNLALKVKSMRNLGFDPQKRFFHRDLFWNYRISGVSSALGNNQIKKIHKTIAMKKKQGEFYNKLLREHDDLFTLPAIENHGVMNNYWVYGILLKKPYSRDSVMKGLLEKLIETRPFFWPLHLQPLMVEYQYRICGSLQVSEDLGENGFYLPIGPTITKRKQKRIVKELLIELDLIVENTSGGGTS